MPIHINKYDSAMTRGMASAQQQSPTRVRGSQYDKQLMDRKYEEADKTRGNIAKVVDGI